MLRKKLILIVLSRESILKLKGKAKDLLPSDLEAEIKKDVALSDKGASYISKLIIANRKPTYFTN